MGRVTSDGSLVQASVYFRYYVNVALVRAGLGERYLEELGVWRSMLEQGLTTWAEVADSETRSDCHAWGASPNVELFRTVLGIDSAAPGFKRVAIRPAMGALTRVSGSVPHPRGEVSVRLELEGGRLDAVVELPQGVWGDFVWGNERRQLAPGRSAFSLRPRFAGGGAPRRGAGEPGIGVGRAPRPAPASPSSQQRTAHFRDA